jgi:hypothetical protein
VPAAFLSAAHDAGFFMSSLEPKQRWTLGIGAALLTLLLSAVFTFGSLDVPFEPKSWREAMALYTVSSFITAALLVFLLILTRTVLRLWTERSQEQLGARFKTKMVVGAMALSLLPVLFMFFVSYSLLNRTLGRWFPRPLEIASEQTQTLLNDLGRTSMLPRLRTLAQHHCSPSPNTGPAGTSKCIAPHQQSSAARLFVGSGCCLVARQRRQASAWRSGLRGSTGRPRRQHLSACRSSGESITHAS